MSFNLAAFTRDHARAAGIPEEHVSAVVHRAAMAMQAVAHLGNGRGREQRIAATPSAVCRRVVAGAVEDHAAGVLERLL